MNVLIVHDGENIPVMEPLDPNGQDSYGFDWSGWLRAGEVITSQQWLLPAGIERGTDLSTDVEIPLYLDGPVTGVYLQNPTPGETHRVTNRVETNQNRREDRSLDIPTLDK